MEELKGIKERIQKLKNANFDILNPKIAEEIRHNLVDIETVLNEIEELESVKKLITQRIIDPVNQNLAKSRNLQRLGLVIASSSLFCAALMLWNTFYYQPKLIKTNTEKSFEAISEKFELADKPIFKNKDGRYGLKGKDDTIILEPIYNTIVPTGKFEDIEYFSISTNNGEGIADQYGSIHVQPDNYSARLGFGGNFIIRNKSREVGVINVRGEIIAPFKYTMFTIFDKDMVIYNLNYKLGIYDLENRREKTPPFLNKYKICSHHDKEYFGKVDSTYNFYRLPNKLLEKTPFTKLVSGLSTDKLGTLIASDGKNWGIINQKNEILVPVNFDTVFIHQSHFIAKKGTNNYVFEIDRNTGRLRTI